jgi:hypothetical protein
MRSWLVHLCALLALCEARCSLFLTADAGYAHAFAQAPERSAAPVNAQIGIGAGGDHGGAGGGWAIRTKLSDNVQQFSLAPFLYAVAGAKSVDGTPPIAGFLLAGFDLFTVESIANQGAGSIGSPFAELGAFVRVHDKFGITAAVAVEDDIRFSDIPNTGYVSFLIGFGIVAYGNGPRGALFR